MTARPSWVQDVLKRYLGEDAEKNRFKPPEPLEIEYERDPFDPSAYYRDIGMLREIGRTGHQRYNEKLARERARQQSAINLHGHQQPQDYKGNTPKGLFGPPLSNYRLTSGYGHRRSPTAGATSNHSGVDLAAPMGTPIYATHDGYVQFSGFNNGYGYHIYLDAGNGVQTFYGHNSKNAVKNGQYVRKGQVIGYVGSTGVSTGPHLHYGVKVNGSWINPSGYY